MNIPVGRLGRLCATAAVTMAAFAPVSLAPSAAQAQAGYYKVQYCNKTGGKLYLAVSYIETPGSKDWVVEGWKNLNAGACVTMTYAAGNYYYYYAEDDGDGFWGKDDFMLCVEHPGPFRRINRANYTCDDSELKGFVARDPEGKDFITENLNP